MKENPFENGVKNKSWGIVDIIRTVVATSGFKVDRPYPWLQVSQVNV